LVRMARDGYGQWARMHTGYRRARTAKGLFAPDKDTEPPGITEAQKRVLDLLLARGPNLRMGVRRIAELMDIDKNTVGWCLRFLRTKGYLRVVDVGHSWTPSQYEVSPTPVAAWIEESADIEEAVDQAIAASASNSAPHIRRSIHNNKAKRA